MKARTGGWERKTPGPVITACMSRSWKVKVCRKNNHYWWKRLSISNQQQGARQVRSNTNLFASYLPTRPLVLDRQTITATESEIIATTKHAILHESSRGKKTPNAYDAIRDECMPLTGSFRGYSRLSLRPSRGAA